MLIQDLSDKKNTIEIHQVSDTEFTINVNGHIVRKSQDLDNILNTAINQMSQILKDAKQIAKVAKVQANHKARTEKARRMTRPEFLASELIKQTRRSNDSRLTLRKDGNLDIEFMKQPVWTNIEVANIEVWAGRTGLCEKARETSQFWMEVNN